MCQVSHFRDSFKILVTKSKFCHQSKLFSVTILGSPFKNCIDFLENLIAPLFYLGTGDAGLFSHWLRATANKRAS